ncbi:MAG: hypothetical protein HYZ42_18800 [Bacteroidetes bacterium]|nr:hypothetical protein [Bacteroidota bacterium]
MTTEQIQSLLDKHPITTNSVRFDYKDQTVKFGYFDGFPDNEELKKTNQWRIVENTNAINYRESNDLKFTTVINGNELVNLTLL